MKKRWAYYTIFGLLLLLAIAKGYSQTQVSAQGSDSYSQVQVSRQFQAQDTGLELANQSAPGSENEPNRSDSVMSPDEITVRPAGMFNYQGQLWQNGNLVNETISITFSLYTVESGGTSWWQETQVVEVNDGLFNVMLGAVEPLNTQAVNFQNQQWLGIQPAGASAELTPRQPLGVVASAMNLMPGATIVDENPSGVYGYSLFIQAAEHQAIFGSSGSGTGIVGITSANEASAMSASASGTGNGSHALEGRMSGDTGSCGANPTECGSGLYATASGDAYAAFLYGQTRSAVIASQADNAFYTLWVDSAIDPNGFGIWTDGASSFNDFVTFNAGKSGYVVDIALNDGADVLEKGDVVVISGFDAPVVGKIPVVRVLKATQANASAVIGVVDVLYEPCQAVEPLEIGQACGGFQSEVSTIQPGEYLGVVTLGAYEAVKVDATNGPIHPGDMLATSSGVGLAMKATALNTEGVSFFAPGTIIGKALGSLEQGTGTIPVFVSSR